MYKEILFGRGLHRDYRAQPAGPTERLDPTDGGGVRAAVTSASTNDSVERSSSLAPGVAFAQELTCRS